MDKDNNLIKRRKYVRKDFNKKYLEENRK